MITITMSLGNINKNFRDKNTHWHILGTQQRGCTSWRRDHTCDI